MAIERVGYFWWTMDGMLGERSLFYPLSSCSSMYCVVKMESRTLKAECREREQNETDVHDPFVGFL